MRALQKRHAESEALELIDVLEPTVRPGHVVIEVAAAGICGTDLHIIKGEYRSSPPVTLGHEVAGVVAAVGESVTSQTPGKVLLIP